MSSTVYKAGDILLCDFNEIDAGKCVGIVCNDLITRKETKGELSILWLTPTSEDKEKYKHLIIYTAGIKYTVDSLSKTKKIRIIGHLDGAELEKTILSSL